MNFEPVAEVIQRTRTVPLNEHFARIYKDDVRSTELSKNIIKFYEEKKKDAGKGSSSDESESDSAADTPVKKNGTPRKYTTKKMFKNPRKEGVLEAAIAAGGLPPFESFDWKNLECKTEAGSAGEHFAGGAPGAAPEISGEFSADEGAAPLFPVEFSADAGAAPLFPGEFIAGAGAAPEITAGAWAAGGNFAGDGGYGGAAGGNFAGDGGYGGAGDGGYGGAGDGGYGGAPAWETGSYATPAKEAPPESGTFESPQPQAAQPRRNPLRTPAFLQKLQNNPAFQQLVHSTPPFPDNRAPRPKVTPPAKCCLFGSGDSSPEPEEGDEGAGPAMSGASEGDAAGTVVSGVSEKDADPLPPAARHARRGLFVEPTPSPKAAGDESSKENEEPIEAGNKKRPRESEPEEAASGRQKKKASPPPRPPPRKASPPPRPPPRKVSPPASMRGGAGRAQLLATAPSQAKTRAQQQATAQSHAKSRAQQQPAAKGHAKSRSQPQQPAQSQGPAKIVVRRVGPRPGAASGGVVVSKVYAPSPSPEKELPPPPPLYEALLREFLALPNVYVRGKGGCTRDLNILGVIRALLTREVYQGVEHRAFFDTKNRAGLGLLYPGKEEEGGNPNLGPSTLELHRRALRLEWVGENILSVLGEAVKNVGVSKVGCLVTKADRDDLEAAFRFHGGVPGQGVDYWLATPDGNLPRIPGAFPEQACLASALTIMQRSRSTAYARSYLVLDECSWGLPIAVKVLLARRHAAERGRTVDAADLRHVIADLNTWRKQAIINDRAPLVKYGLKLTEYCRRLEAIARSLGVHVPPSLSLRDGAVAVFDERALRAEAGAKPELTSKRLKEEQAELRDALTALGLVSSPAAEQIHRIRSAVASAMAADSHQRLSTSNLHPSPSMPDAVYSPLSYDRAFSGAGGGAH